MERKTLQEELLEHFFDPEGKCPPGTCEYCDSDRELVLEAALWSLNLINKRLAAQLSSCPCESAKNCPRCSVVMESCSVVLESMYEINGGKENAEAMN